MQPLAPFLCRFLRTVPVPGRYLEPILKMTRVSGKAIVSPILATDRWRSFMVLIDNLEDPIEKHIYYQGYFEWKETQFVRKCLDEGDIVFDVGANIGWYTLLAASLVKNTGKVFAFEPLPESRRRLNENCLLNKLENVEIFGFAVGKAHGEALIYSGPPKDVGGASLFRGDSETYDQHTVQVRPLDEVIEQHKIRRAKLCKIDIEGSEIDALEGMKGALKNKVFKFILIEINAVALERAGYRPEDLVSRIRTAGYSIRNIQCPQIDVSVTGVEPFGNYVCVG